MACNHLILCVCVFLGGGKVGTHGGLRIGGIDGAQEAGGAGVSTECEEMQGEI